jgi:hypothetical protein
MNKIIYSLTRSSLFIFLIIIGACHKNNGSSSYISYFVNGSVITYSTDAECILSADDSLQYYSADFLAYNSDHSSQIVITLNSSSPISTSSIYVDTVNLAGPPVSISLYPPEGFLGSNPATASSGFLYPNHVVLQFTEITSSYVRGTFSGNIAAPFNGPVTQISGGIFYLPVE